VHFAVRCGCCVSEFKTKAGRLSPYFFNAGLFNDGEKLAASREFYARRLLESGLAFDMLFGPAYKASAGLGGGGGLARLGRNYLRLQPQGGQGPCEAACWSARRCRRC